MDNILNILKKIIWDYNISPEEVYKCLKGQIDKSGFYTRNDLILKMLEHLYWYEIIKVVPLEEIKAFLTVSNVKKIYPKGLQLKYEFLRKLLYQEIISSTGWDSKDNEFPEYTILSNRWYCFR
ncbi:MAG: hypothetical protein KAT05_16865 [Spirochaetes bacterium]|nr:hypothetical protein [Spirochaetota bacterium]